MRTLWNVLSFLAVVHLLALIMFVGWLWQSDRLSAARIQEVRGLFAPTTAQAKAAVDAAAAEALREQQKQADADRAADPPLDSASQIQYISLIRQQQEQSKRRLEDEKKSLQSQLTQATDEVSRKQAALDQQRIAWENATRGDQQRKTDEQFLQTVRQYEQLSPKQSKRMLIELVNQKQMDQAVAYLNAMNVRAASKILKEFKTDQEIVLATELLERLRTYGHEDANDTESARMTSPTADSKAAQESGHVNGPASPVR